MKIIVLLLSISFCALAKFDLSLGTSFRSYPSIGAEINAESGYNLLLWGKVNKKKPFYGFIRPAVTLSSSVVINSYDARIEFNPISFISIVRGYRHVASKFNEFSFYNCEQVRCTGDLKKDYTKLKFAMGAARILTMVELAMYNNEYTGGTDEKVAEFRFATLADSQNDSMYHARYVLGFKHNTGLYGVMADYTLLNGSGDTYNMDLLIYTTKVDRSLYTFGIGQFYTSQVEKGVIAVFQMKTKFIEGFSLF
jgi:hypothetical protein